MAEHTKGERFSGAEEFGALSEARAAFEMVEQEHGRVERERRRLRERLDGLLTSLRHGSVLLLFDADGELAGAEGAFDDILGVELADLVTDFENFAGEETRRSLEEANEQVMALDSAGVAISRSFLATDDNRVGFTWIHVRRHDDDEDLVGTEVIGLVSPQARIDEITTDAEDPFESVIQQVARRLLADSQEATIRRSMEAFGSSFSADRVVINRYDEDDRTFSILSSWLRADTEPLAAETKGIAISALPWAYSLLGAGEAVAISERADLPREARLEKRLYASDGVKSSLLVPMVRDDHLFGFVSIQSLRASREWTPTDIANARGFVRLLSATLARAEVEGELAKAREEAISALERAEGAEARAEEAENHAKDSGEKLATLTSEADDARRRIEGLEKDVEKARDAEKEARSAVADERGRADDVRKESDELRKESEGLRKEVEALRKDSDELRKAAEAARRELETFKADAQQQQRHAADDAADTRELRSQLENARAQAEKAREEVEAALRDAAEARSEPAELRQADRLAVRASRDETPRLAALNALHAEATAEMAGGGSRGRGFDPDATVEMELSGLSRRGGNNSVELGARTARLDRPEEMPGGSLRERSADILARAAALDEMIEHDRTAKGPRSTGTGFGDGIWSDKSANAAQPRFLRDEEEDADDHEDDDRDPDRSEDDAFAGDDARDLAAARTMARRAAGKDEDRDEHDWWGVRAGDEDAADRVGVEGDDDEADAADADGVDGGADDRWSADTGSGARDYEEESGEEDERDVVFETAWGKRDTSSDEMAEWDTEPPAQSLAFADDESEDHHGEDDLAEVDEPVAVEVPNLDGIDAEIGLQDVGGNVELYRSLLIKFRNDYIGAAAKIDSAIEKGNIEVAHLLLHAIKGVSGILGAMPVREAADELETRLIGRDPDATRAALHEFTGALTRALDSIATLDGAPTAGVAMKDDDASAWATDEDDDDDDGDEKTPVSEPMVLRSYLSGLRQHLKAEKPRQCQLVMREIRARRWPPEFDSRVTELGELIDDGCFDDARDVFEELMVMFEGD